jgi:misacylated tRNA(Ala) deacylase
MIGTRDRWIARIADVRKNHGDVRHVVGSMDGDSPESGTEIEWQVDEERRETLGQMHTAQHVVSRVVFDEYGAETAGNQIHRDRSRADVVVPRPSPLTALTHNGYP